MYAEMIEVEWTEYNTLFIESSDCAKYSGKKSRYSTQQRIEEMSRVKRIQCGWALMKNVLARLTLLWILIARRWFNYTSNRPFPANDDSTTISPWNYCTPVISIFPRFFFPPRYLPVRAVEKRQKAESKKIKRIATQAGGTARAEYRCSLKSSAAGIKINRVPRQCSLSRMFK